MLFSMQSRRIGWDRPRMLLAFAAALLLPLRTPAESLSSIVVYGDSLSDNGNLFAATGQPGAPYYAGRRSNGPVAVEQMATRLGVPLVDYAWTGATTGTGNYGDQGSTTTSGTYHLPGMLTEFSSTQQAITPYLGGLFIVWGGPNDFLAPSPLDQGPQDTIARGVGNLVTIVDQLLSRGATNILVPGMPDLGLTPYFHSLGPATAAAASVVTNAFNAALVSELPTSVKFVDTAALLRSIVAHPAAYGFTNVTEACFDGFSVCADPSQYLFFDDFHPTTQADALVAQEFLATTAPEPGMAVCVAGALFVTFLVRFRVRRT
jgi:phospholipase/lecithinase/hemolysin